MHSAFQRVQIPAQPVDIPKDTCDAVGAHRITSNEEGMKVGHQ